MQRKGGNLEIGHVDVVDGAERAGLAGVDKIDIVRNIFQFLFKGYDLVVDERKAFADILGKKF